jgi:hypothetical protein
LSEHPFYLGKTQCCKGVPMEGDLRSNSTEKIRPRLQHCILEVFTQKVGIAPWDGGPRLEGVLFGRICHLHEKLDGENGGKTNY